eukprot:983255_1
MRVAAKEKEQYKRSVTVNSINSHYSMLSLQSMQSLPCMDEMKDITVLQIEEIVNLNLSQCNDTFDRDEFVDMLSECGIHEKLNKDELFNIFNQLKVAQSAADHDHPNYSPRRTVYRVCRRLSKV